MAEAEEPSQSPRAGWVITIIVCAIIVGVTAGIIWLINNTEPTAEKSGATRKSAALVETVAVSRRNYRPEIVVLGTVEPSRDVMLAPRVEGEVVEIAENFEPGGFVEKGELLLRIDPADFQNVLAMRQSELREAKATLAIEEGQRNVAQKEFQLLDEEIDPENRALVLREPQIESAKARVQSAQAMVEQAQLELDRTEVRAPFDAQVLQRNVNLGSQVARGHALARLVGIEEYWVIATVPLRNLRWLSFADQGEVGSRVSLRNRGAWELGETRQGSIARLIGTVDEQTRLARVLIKVPNPLARQKDAPPVVLGTLLETRIEGREIPDVVRLDRDYLRDGDTVWVKAEGKLAIRDVEVIFRDANYAYIREGLADGDLVVKTSLATVAAGIPLQEMENPESTGGES